MGSERFKEEVTTFGMSFTETKNKVGPWGTPDVTEDQFENVPPIVILCCLFFLESF